MTRSVSVLQLLTLFLFTSTTIDALPRVTLPLKKRGTLTAQYATEQEGPNYLLSNNLWGMYSGSGSQITTFDGLSGNVVSWETTYSWSGGTNQVKSYSNIGLTSGLGHSLSAIGSIPTTWSWTYRSASSDLIADVSYDLWLSNDSGCGQAVGCSTFEVMIWLSKRGACQPAGSFYKSVEIAGVTWALWKGNVQNWVTYSFVAPSEIMSFSSDLLLFFDFLVTSEGISSSQYVTGVQSGTEPFDGTATLKNLGYSVAINTGTPPPVTTTSTTSAGVSTAPTSVTTVTTQTSSTPSGTSVASCVGNSNYAQCGGIGWSGSTCCPSGWTCQYLNDYYYQCLPASTTKATTPPAATSTTKVVSLSIKTTSKSTTTTTKSQSSTTTTKLSSSAPPPPKTSSTTTTFSSSPSTTSCVGNSNYAQCGGIGWTGSTCCPTQFVCTYNNPYYSQCLLSSNPPPPSAACVGGSQYGQCGGLGWSGSTCCPSGWSCEYSNPYYSQCLPS